MAGAVHPVPHSTPHASKPHSSSNPHGSVGIQTVAAMLGYRDWNSSTVIWTAESRASMSHRMFVERRHRRQEEHKPHRSFHIRHLRILRVHKRAGHMSLHQTLNSKVDALTYTRSKSSKGNAEVVASGTRSRLHFEIAISKVQTTAIAICIMEATVQRDLAQASKQEQSLSGLG